MSLSCPRIDQNWNLKISNNYIDIIISGQPPKLFMRIFSLGLGLTFLTGHQHFNPIKVHKLWEGHKIWLNDLI